MKKILVMAIVAGMFSALPVFAGEHDDMNMDKMDMHEGMKMDMSHDHEGMMMDTHEGMRECALQAETIQQKIKRIQSEINQGSRKYDAAEMKKLAKKLKEANDILEGLQHR